MPGLTIRHPMIAIDALTLSPQWLGGNGFVSQLFNAMSMSFPVGEGFFIASVQAALPRLDDPELAETVRRFIGQEANHSRLHLALNRRLSQVGLRNLVEPLARWRIRHSEGLAMTSKLAITMAYEHFTATFGDFILCHPEWLDGTEPAMRDLWMWHCVEEMEHRSVAYDVYRALGGGVMRRLVWFWYVSLLFLVDSILQTLLNLRGCGLLWKTASWRQAARFLLGRGGLVWAVLPAWLDYLRPGYHPSQRGEDALATQWLAGKDSLFIQ